MAMNTPALLRSAATLALLFLGAAPAAARQDDGGADYGSARMVGWSLTPAVAAGATRDTNVALSSPRADLGATQGDTLLTVAPSLRLAFVGKRTDFSAGYGGALRRYTTLEGLDEFDQRSTVSLRHAASRRLQLFGRNSFSRSPTTDEVEVNGVPFRRTGSSLNTTSAGADFRLTKFTSLSATYDSVWVDFERDAALEELTGGRIHGLQADVRRQVNTRMSVGGLYTYRTASLDQGAREFSFQNAGVTVEGAVARHTTASAAVGLAMLNDRQQQESRRGAYLRFGARHELEAVRLGASFERQYVPSFGFGGASSSQEMRGYVQAPLWRNRLYTRGSVTWRRSTPFEEQGLQLDTTLLRSAIGWAASRWGRVEGLYTYTRQDSIVTGGEVDRHRIGILFIVSQPMRLR